MASTKEKFVSAAVGYLGHDCRIFNSFFGNPSGTAWCAEFVSKCASDCGALNKCIVKSAGAGSIARESVANGWGIWLEGNNSIPSSGDIISFTWNGLGYYPNQDKYFSDHVGIVEKVSNGIVYTIEGNANGTNTSSTVCRKTYALYSGNINGYYRPNWNLVDKNNKEDEDMDIFEKPDTNNGVLAYKALLLIAKTLGMIKSGVDKSAGFGNGTYNATVELQKKYKLSVDGQAGVKTITTARDEILKQLATVLKTTSDRNVVLEEAISAIKKLKG